MLPDCPNALQDSRDASRGDVLEYLSIVVERVEVHDSRGESASVRLKPRERRIDSRLRSAFADDVPTVVPFPPAG